MRSTLAMMRNVGTKLMFILASSASSEAFVMRPRPTASPLANYRIPPRENRPTAASKPFPCPRHKRAETSLNSISTMSSGVLALSKDAAHIFIKQMKRHKILNVLLVFTAVASTLLAKKIDKTSLLWPGTRADPDFQAPLPPGSFGCPFLGVDFFSGSKEYGPFAALAKLAKKNKNAKIWKTYSFGLPIVSVSGVENIKSVLKNEFAPEGQGVATYLMAKHNLDPLFGSESMLYEPDAKKHALLRKLVGAAMTTTAISEAIPSIQETASVQIENMLKADGAVTMEKVFNDYTLDVAWSQILGLDLKEEEIPKFRRTVEEWTAGVMNPLFFLPFRVPVKLTKTGRAREYLESKVKEKLDSLEKNGPDSSTLSKLYFARDDGDEGETKLTRKQVIDNALLLIFAGTETSRSTLTCASLILALHPQVMQKMRDEQNEVRSKYGEDLSTESLERCVYLDAVIKETLRVKPVEAGELREVKSTVVVDGQQIPKNYFALLNIRQTHMNDPATYLEDESHMDIRTGFKPDRWLDESTKPMAWMPFSEGKRRCIGERLGMTEMKIFLAMLARKVDYKLVNPIASGDPVLWKTNTPMARPLDGVEVNVHAV